MRRQQTNQKQTNQSGNKPKLTITGTYTEADIRFTGVPEAQYAFVLGTKEHQFQEYVTDGKGTNFAVVTDGNGLWKPEGDAKANFSLRPEIARFPCISVMKVGEPNVISDPFDLTTLPGAPTGTPGTSPFASTATSSSPSAIKLTLNNPGKGFGYHPFNFTVDIPGGIQAYRIRTSQPSDYTDRTGVTFRTGTPARESTDVAMWEVNPPAVGNTDNFTVAPVGCYSLIIWVELVATGEASNKITVETTIDNTGGV